jgi:hypothetical protein
VQAVAHDGRPGAWNFGELALAAALLRPAGMRRLHTLLLISLTAAAPALAEVHLLPQASEGGLPSTGVVARGSDRGSATAVGVGVASLLLGATSLVVGVVSASSGQWQLFVPLVVIVPLVATLFGTLLISAGALAEVAAADDANDELPARRVALSRARDAASTPTTGACAEQPAPVVSAPPSTPTQPPLVPTGHTRGPLKPAPVAP